MNPSFFQFIVADHLALAAGCAAGVGMSFFFCGVQLFAHKQSSGVRKIAVSAAVPGLAAISGKATGPRTIAAPISGKPCYVYRTSIWQQESGVKKEWKNVAEETGHLTFLIEDETGRLLVEPSGAELDLRQNLSQEYGWPFSSPNQTSNQLSNSDQPSSRHTVPDAVSSFLARNGVTLDRPTRVEEYCLLSEMPVSITGTVSKNSAMQPDSLAYLSSGSSSNPREVAAGAPLRQQPNPTPAGSPPQPEVIRLASSATPQSTAQMSQQAKIAAALAKAGLSQRDMWATNEAGPPGIPSGANGHPKPGESQPNSTSDATATPSLASAMTMTMTKGPDDPTFIISNHQPESRISVGWKFVALVLAGSTLTTLGLYVLLFAHPH